jgi:uncharacterized membrane protein YkvA (DUF1232 family)
MSPPRRQLMSRVRSAGKAGLATYLIALWKLFKHPRTPRPVKWLAIAVLAYAVSPIDLIPDFIPVLGQLDDLVIVPLGIALALKLTPQPLWDEVWREAQDTAQRLPPLWAGSAFVVAVWLAFAALIAWAVYAVW